MHIAHRGLNVGVAHGILHCIDVSGLIIERSPEGVAQIVVAKLPDPGLCRGPPPYRLKASSRDRVTLALDPLIQQAARTLHV